MSLSRVTPKALNPTGGADAWKRSSRAAPPSWCRRSRRVEAEMGTSCGADPWGDVRYGAWGGAVGRAVGRGVGRGLTTLGTAWPLGSVTA